MSKSRAYSHLVQVIKGSNVASNSLAGDHRPKSGHPRSLMLPQTSLTGPVTPSGSRLRKKGPSLTCSAFSSKVWIFAVIVILNSVCAEVSASEDWRITTQDPSLGTKEYAALKEESFTHRVIIDEQQIFEDERFEEIFGMYYEDVANMSSEEWRNFSCQNMELENHFIKSVLEPIICLCGILGILLTMIVLSRKTMCTSTNCYLTALAVGDLLFLCILTTRTLVDRLGDCHFHISSERTIFLVYSIIFMEVFQYLTVGVTVMLAVERYIAICHPMKAMTVCTVKRARIIICILALISFILRCPKFLDIKISYTTLFNGKTLLTVTWVYLYDEQAYTYIVTGLLLTIIPLLMLLVLNVRLIVEIRRSSRYLRYHLANDSHERSVVSSEQLKITMMLVAVIVAFFVCNAPYLIYSLIMAISSYDPVQNPHLTNSECLRLFKFVCHSLLAIKSSCNFVLYCWFSEKFCTTFKRIFCLHSCQVRPSSSAVANNSCHANGYNNNSHYTNNGRKHVHRPSCYITKETTC